MRQRHTARKISDDVEFKHGEYFVKKNRKVCEGFLL